jgi:hypothetical protein
MLKGLTVGLGEVIALSPMASLCVCMSMMSTGVENSKLCKKVENSKLLQTREQESFTLETWEPISLNFFLRNLRIFLIS